MPNLDWDNPVAELGQIVSGGYNSYTIPNDGKNYYLFGCVTGGSPMLQINGIKKAQCPNLSFTTPLKVSASNVVMITSDGQTALTGCTVKVYTELSS